MSLRTPAVTSDALEGETYAEFQKRVAKDAARVKKKVAGLDLHTPYCPSCGETVGPEKAGTPCKENNVGMASKWARKRAEKEFYQLGHFGGIWASEVDNLACLLDRVWAEAQAAKR